MSLLGFNDSPTPNWVIAADLTAAVAVSARADPALPLQTVTLATMQAPPLKSRFQLTDRNTLLYDGISTFTVADDGTVAIENLITTYQKNSFGDPDDSYLEVETMNTLMAVLRRLRSIVTSKYARKKLAADGTRVLPGTNVVTPSMIRADVIAEYQSMEDQDGWVRRQRTSGGPGCGERPFCCCGPSVGLDIIRGCRTGVCHGATRYRCGSCRRHSDADELGVLYAEPGVWYVDDQPGYADDAVEHGGATPSQRTGRPRTRGSVVAADVV